MREPIRRYTLDGNLVHSLAELYDELSRQLLLPKEFGRNLDALWDVLSADVEGPFEIVWRNSGVSKSGMKKDFERLMKMFRELELERNDFRIIIE